MLCNKDGAGVPLTAEECDFRVDADGEEELDISAKSIYMKKLQEVVYDFEADVAPT